MIGLLASLFARWGISERVSRVLAIGGLILALAALAGLLWLWLDSREKADDRANQQTGATTQREADLTATVTTARKADEAADTVRRDPDAALAECLQNARNPGDC